MGSGATVGTGGAGGIIGAGGAVGGNAREEISNKLLTRTGASSADTFKYILASSVQNR